MGISWHPQGIGSAMASHGTPMAMAVLWQWHGGAMEHFHGNGIAVAVVVLKAHGRALTLP